MKEEKKPFAATKEEVKFNQLQREVDHLKEEQGAVKKEATKNARRNNLNFNILKHFSKEMWVYAIIISVTCGFALGVMLVNLHLSRELQAAQRQQCGNLSIELYQ